MSFLKAESKKRIIPIALIGVMAGALLMPLGLKTLYSVLVRVQPILRRLNESQLAATTVVAPRPRLTLHHWLSGDFQKESEAWFNQNFAGREFLVRMNNQIAYSLFRRGNVRTSQILIGKDQHLMESGYVDEYVGIDPPTHAADLEALVREMKVVQDRLQRRGIGFLVMLTPTKPTLYPEYMPAAFQSLPPPVRSYDLFLPLVQRYGVHYLDGPRLLRDAKAARPEPLFCQGGTHYNELGGFYQARGLAAKLAEVTGEPVPELRYDSILVDRKPVGMDADLANLLNLLRPPLDYPAPHLKLGRGSGANSLANKKISIVGGSFCWMPLGQLFDAGILRQMDFFFYYHTSRCTWPEHKITDTVDVEHLDWDKTFLNSAAIVVEINQSVLKGTERSHYRAFFADVKKHLPE